MAPQPPASPAEVRRWQARVRELERQATRLEKGACVAEGIHAVEQALAVGLGIEALFVCLDRVTPEVERIARLAGARGAPVLGLSLGRFLRLAHMDNPVGLVGVVCWRPSPLDELSASVGDLLLVTDGIEEPGNLGTLIRTAEGAGAGGVIAAGTGADPAHRRCLRASLGMAFRLPVAVAATASAAVAWAAARGFHVVAAAPDAALTYLEARLPRPLALVVGNERQGLRPETRSACTAAVRVPMYGVGNSLNVTAAAAVILYDLRRRWQAGGPPEASLGPTGDRAAPSPSSANSRSTKAGSAKAQACSLGDQ